MPEPLFERLCVIGLGLIGSSIARVAVERHGERGGLCRELVVTDRSPAVLERARALGIADRVEADAAVAVRGADCVMLAAPVGSFAAIAATIAPVLAPGTIVTDVGSTKMSVIRDVGPLLPEGVRFVPGHPMAGTEYSGPDSGFSTLFEGRWALLTPVPGGDAAAVERMAEFWRRCGSMVEVMTPSHHDRVVAIVSHLPHLLAFTICGTADDLAQEGRGRGGDTVRGAEICGVGVSRLHADRGERPGDVARRVPEQPGGAAGDAGAVYRGCAGDGAGGPVGGRVLYRGQDRAGAGDPAEFDRAQPSLGRVWQA